MAEFTKARPPRDLANQTEEQRVARERMALFPYDEKTDGGKVEIIFTADDMWVVRMAPLAQPDLGNFEGALIAACRASRWKAVHLPGNTVTIS
jgi:hypothetical protein